MKKILLFLLFSPLFLAAQQSMTLLQPAAGISWDGATSHSIRWQAQNVNLLKIEFSANDGATWQVVEEAYPATANAYNWTVPAQPTDSARIRLSDTDNPAIKTVSGLFTIPEPYITLVQPNNLNQENAFAIRWQSSCIFNLNILYSIDGGINWDTIFGNVDAPPGIKNWPVPQAAPNCLVKLVDAASPEMFAVSEAFAISEAMPINPAKYHGGSFDGYARGSNLAPQLAIISPAGGEVWDGSSTQLLSWNAQNTYRIMLLFSIDGGTTWPDTLQTLYPAEAYKYGITVPNTPTTTARFKLVSLDVPGLETESGDFTIPEPFIEIFNDFDFLYAGTPYPIRWQSSGVSQVNIFYSPDASASWDTIALNVEATRGIKNWKVPEATEEGRIRISDSTGSIFAETGIFTIAPLPQANPAKYHGGSFDGYAMRSNLAPTLNFVNPLGGEVWDGSSAQSIQWEAVNTYRLMILFSTDDGVSWPDTLQTLYPAEALKLDIVIPNTPSDAARFKLVSLDVEGLEAISEAFIIPQPFITITNQFTNMYAGTPYPIFWESSGISHVNIGYSPDGGINWDTIAINIPATRGIKNWKVPALTINGMIAIADADLQYSDQSEAFTILDLPQHNPIKYRGGSYDGYAQWWFKTADSNCPNDTTVCECDPAFELTGAIPPGGTYSGPGVANGVFDPAISGIGIHKIYYESTYINGTTVCSFNITVFAPSMIAKDDMGIPVNGTLGGVSVSDVLINDSLHSMPVVADEVSLEQISSTHPLVNLDPQSGEVYLMPGTPAGNYELVYEVCEIANPSDCDQATAMVSVYEFPMLSFCFNDQEAEAGVTLSFCSNQRIAFNLCDVQNGEAPFTICWERDGVTDCDLTVYQGDTLISDFFAEGMHNIKILSITDNLGGTVTDLSTYNFDFDITMGSESFAGNDNTICAGDSLALNNAFATGFTSLQWSGGDGTFVPSNEVQNPEYHPGSQDISTGMVELCITAYSIDPCTSPSFDCLNLTIQSNPMANAGEDLTVCESDMFVEILGSVENAAYVEWTTDSFTGFFDDAGSPATTYFFSQEDISLGTVELCLTAIPKSPCVLPETDCLDLAITLNPVANAGNDQTICEGESIELSMANVENASNVAWNTSGDGFFNDPTLVSAIYFPGPNDISLGTVQLCIYAYPQAGCTNSNNDCMNLNIIETPMANLGNDRYLNCEDYDVSNGQWLPVNIFNTITEDYLSIQWTSDGDGTFDEPTAISPNYYPGLTDRWKGNIELEINILWSSNCQFSSTQSLMLFIPQQIIYFHTDKWLGISSYLETELETVAEVMEPMVLIPGSQYLVNMVDKQGRYYWPEPIPPQSTLGDWLPIGYKLKVKNTPACLPIYGDSLFDQTFAINGSFTYLPVLTNVPADIETLFAGHLDDILLIYHWGDNQLWTPIASDFDNLYPGYAYLLVNKFGFDDYDIAFPDFSPDAPLLTQGQLGASADKFIPPWKKVQDTEFFHFFLFSKTATENLMPGDILGVLNKNDECYGLAEYGKNNDVFKIVAMGDEKLNNIVGGFGANDQLSFKIYRPQSNEEFEVSFVYDEQYPSHKGEFAENGISMVTNIIGATSSIMSSTQSIQLYPNPTTGLLNIYGIAGDYELSVFNAVQEQILTTKLSGIGQIDLSSYPKGIYLIKLTTKDYSVTRKVVVD